MTTIAPAARPIALRAVVDERSGDVVRVALEGAIRRSEFGLDWPALGEAGRRLIGDRVRLSAHIVLAHIGDEEGDR